MKFLKNVWLNLGWCILFPALWQTAPVQAGFWNDVGSLVGDVVNETTKGGADLGSLLSNEDIAAGLKEALSVGFEKAVASAGATDGFWKNSQIRIPEPDALQKIAGLLYQVGLGREVDEFRYTMNQAASQAAGEAMPVFLSSIKKMTFSDVKTLWKGDDHAVTDFFKTTTSDELRRRFTPIIQKNLNNVGVTGLYQEIVSQPVVSMTLGQSLPELDHYVTDKALDGLFSLMADEEKKIRTDPAARTTELLIKVFGQK
ncbi:MAG: DUF4197 domain-containing protein [Proteobacteria bacterium]|nr:DUF4197 domain-containing protein [Pseudomonadota bacterium]MBU1640655.1 DUF4197 domain-containing protein [Pseudomonadota bacterium]